MLPGASRATAKPRALAFTFGVLLVGIVSVGVADTPVGPPAFRGAATPLMVSGDDLTWKPLHPGSEMAVLSGDPTKAGSPFVMRFRYRGVVRVPPHWHQTDEHITVLSGSFVLGLGERFDESSAKELKAGGYALVPRKMPHFAWSKQDTVLQVHGIGPFAIIYLNPMDDPNRPAGGPK